MTTISIFNGKERDKRYAILLWHDVETGRDTTARLDETDAATLRDALTAWLDAPRLAARKTPTVVAERDGIRLLTTSSGEWGVADDESPSWLSCEAEARCEFRYATGTVSCESCARFIERGDACVDDDGIYTCADETACSAACAAKESK